MGNITKFVISAVFATALQLTLSACSNDSISSALPGTTQDLPQCTAQTEGATGTIYSDSVYNRMSALMDLFTEGISQYCKNTCGAEHASCAEMLTSKISYKTVSRIWTLTDLQNRAKMYAKLGDTYVCNKDGEWSAFDINGFTDDDAIVEMTFDPDGALDMDKVEQSLFVPAIESCIADPTCFDKYSDFLEETSSSSAESNSTDLDTIVVSSSSMMIPFKFSSSSLFIISSVSNTITGLGTCTTATGVTTIEKDSSVQFKFSPNTSDSYTAMNFVMASYTWNYGEGIGDGTATALHSDNVTFTTPGSKNVSVTVTMNDGNVETVQCTPLHVNGEPITGCTCTSDATTADVASGGVATWTVTGCTSASEIISYSWTGATGTEATASYTFTEKGQTLAPSVAISNADNTIEIVSCNEVKAIDSNAPEYILELSGNIASSDKISVPDGACITVSGSWDNEFYRPTLTVECSADGYATSTEVSMTISHEADSVSETGSYLISLLSLSLGQLTVGDIYYNNICISLIGANEATCSLSSR